MSSPGTSPILRLRLINIDTVQVPPSTLPLPTTTRKHAKDIPLLHRRSPFFEDTIGRVPEIRVFGITEHGERCCMHIHGALPYIYIDYKDSLDPTTVNSYIQRLGHALNRALALVFPSSASHFVPYIVLAKGIPFYGFHVGYRYYLKIYSSDPKYMYKLVSLLRGGAILGQTYFVYESHLPFIIQFMGDFNLYGCGWIDISNCKFRTSPLPRRIPASCRYPTGSTPSKVSRCHIEIDTHVDCIINRSKAPSRPLHHDFTEYLKDPVASDEKLVNSVKELWEDEEQRRDDVGEKLNTFNSDYTPRHYASNEAPQWSSDALFKEFLDQLYSTDLNAFRDSEALSRLSFETFIKHDAHQERIRTTWEQVEAVFPGCIHSDETNKYEYGLFASCEPGVGKNDQGKSDIDVSFLKKFDRQKRTDVGGCTRNFSTSGSEDGDHAILSDDSEENDFPEDGTVSKDEFSTHDTGPQVQQRDSSKRREVCYSGRSARNEGDDGDASTHESNGKMYLELSGKAGNDEMKDSTSPISDDSGKLSPLNEHNIEEMPLPQQMSFLSSTTASLTPTEVDETEQFQDPSPFEPTANSFTSISGSNSQASRSSIFRKPDPGPSLSESHLAPSSLSGERKSSQKGSIAFSPTKSAWRRYATSPPDKDYLLNTLEVIEKRPFRQYSDPHFSVAKDVPKRAREYGGRSFTLRGTGLQFHRDFHHLTSVSSWKPPTIKHGSTSGHWEYAIPPPSKRQILRWLSCSFNEEKSEIDPIWYNENEIEGPTRFLQPKLSERDEPSNMNGNHREISMLCMELHANSRGDLLPNPELDSITAIFYAFLNDDEEILQNGRLAGTHVGAIIINPSEKLSIHRLGLSNVSVEAANDELELINSFVDLVQSWDPEILAGFEIQNSSWGYLLERAQYYDYDLVTELGRTVTKSTGRNANRFDDQWGFRKSSTIKVTGRHVLPIWRIVRGEVDLLGYSLQNVAYHVLRKVVPRFHEKQLSKWFADEIPEHLSRVLRFYIDWVQMDVEIMEEINLITQTAEFARVFGIDFASVLSRGSQFKVESVMSRISKPESFVLISPSRENVGKQNAAECIPLILEPQSAFYKAPLLVLDFQSLYPSCMIAYNYCYSTCLGRLRPFKGSNKLGVLDLDLPPGLLTLLKDHINVSPNGIMFVKPYIRKSLLAKMLAEILDTRVMIKESMKKWRDNKSLMKVLDARQLGLKFIANVTYGYTSASFSGRMPCVEIADAIVQTGRETLENAKRTIQEHPGWGARVVYGDTDSLFVYLPGKTKEQAFQIGNNIADFITSMNPAPIRLKFEKIYFPSVLMAKKRYVGFKYESLSEKSPDFDAKGIETVRRDGFPAMQKMLETSLKILFETQDLSQIKQYLHSQWTKMIEGRIVLKDFTYAKAVKLGTYSANSKNLPPGVVIAARKMAKDPRSEPQYGERVPFIIPYSGESAKQAERALTPHEFLEDHRNVLDAEHYIDATCRAIGRVLDLVGVDIWTWKRELPKRSAVATTNMVQIQALNKQKRESNKETTSSSDGGGKGKFAKVRIDEHFRGERCFVCGGKSVRGDICIECKNNRTESYYTAIEKLKESQGASLQLHKTCSRCIQQNPLDLIKCISIDCPLYYKRVQNEAANERNLHTLELLSKDW